jgi:nitronate monooxygenase
MPLPDCLKDRLSIPLISAPLFLVSGPELVIAACKAGVVGAFPSLNARPTEEFGRWLERLEDELDEGDAPFAVNLIVHKSNPRVAEDLALIKEHKVPLVITSVGQPGDVVEEVHSYGGAVFHDVINLRHARKAMEAGVDGIILVAAGAGGHGGLINPFTLVPQVRAFFDGTIILAGTLSNGRSIRAAQVLGADLAYMGTRFIATREANAEDAFKQMILQSGPLDVVYTDKVSGIKGNFLLGSLAAAGVDIEELAKPEAGFGKSHEEKVAGRSENMTEEESKAWKDVWSAGQGVGEIHDIPAVAELVARLREEYQEACATP